MVEHVTVLGWLGVARACVAFGLAGWGFVVLQTDRFRFLAEAGDAQLITLGGIVVALVGAVRLTQALGALLVRPWARRLGLGLAVFDLVNLTVFPLSTGLGLYALVAYRNPETVEYFDSHRRHRLSAAAARAGPGGSGA